MPPSNPITPIPNTSYTNTTPSVLWRYDAAPDTSIPHNPNNDGNINNSTITLMAKVYYPAGPFMYLSGARGNTFPTDADYIFCSAWGGIRIPRKVNTSIIIIQAGPNNTTNIKIAK